MADSILSQLIAAIEQGVSQERIESLKQQLSQQDLNFLNAMNEVNVLKDFIGSPENILGSEFTKHGEIAEQVQVSISNARSFFNGGERVASMDSDRIGAVDYHQDGIAIQSKFINGATGNNSLSHVLDHMDKYPNFMEDGHAYHIPKDQYEVIEKIMAGNDVSGFSEKSIKAVLEKVKEIEQHTGREFGESVKPSLSDYSDVQKGNINKTVEEYENNLKEENAKHKQNINDHHTPSWGEAAKVVGAGAAVGASCQVGFKVYSKYKSGKNIFKGEFSKEDWIELGVDAIKGGGKGAIFGGGIYAITNFTDISAPMAGALVNATFQVVTLANKFKNGEISKSEFIELGLISCTESSFVAIGAIAGQAIIPVPVLGPMVGSIAARYLFTLSQDIIGDHFNLEKELDALYGDC